MPLSSVVGAQSIVKPGVCTSSTRPASPYDGQVIYETDTNRTLAFNGSTWDILSDMGAWTAYTPTVTSSGGSITTVGAVSAVYQQVGKTVFVNFSVAITTVGTASGQLLLTLPVSSSTNMPVDGAFGTARETVLTGFSLTVSKSAGGRAAIYKYDGSGVFPLGNGVTAKGFIIYEAA